MAAIEPVADDAQQRESIMLFAGAALVVFGAGLILSNRAIRQYVGKIDPSGLLQTALPDLERYLKIRGM